MSEEISIQIDGKMYTATFEVFEDTLAVLLPDNTTRHTELRGLNPKSAATVHLKSYAKQYPKA